MQTPGFSEKTVLGLKMRSVDVGFVVSKVAVRHFYLRVMLRFLAVRIVPALLSTHPAVCNRCGRILAVCSVSFLHAFRFSIQNICILFE